MNAEEKKAMSGPVELNVIEEPMDHFTTFDDSYLKQLLNDNMKGSGYNTYIIKDDMKNVAEQVMAHWYNIKGFEF